jgi:hypothetical protein
MTDDDELIAFGRRDVDELQDVLRWWRRQQMTTPPRAPESIRNAPDVYIARTPAAGIPARQGDPGSASPGSPGSGTGTDSAAYDVFWATCRCYRIDDSVSSDVDVFLIDQKLTVYNLSKNAIPGKTLIYAIKDKTGKWVAVPFDGTGGSSAGFWARLTNKAFISGGYIRYTFEYVTDSDIPTAITWTDAGVSIKYAYEVNNVDIPVALSESPGSGTGTHTAQDAFPTIVWMWPSNTGRYYLFWAVARWEIVEIVSGSAPTYIGYIKRYDQTNPTPTLFNFEKCIIIDANALA